MTLVIDREQVTNPLRNTQKAIRQFIKTLNVRFANFGVRTTRLSWATHIPLGLAIQVIVAVFVFYEFGVNYSVACWFGATASIAYWFGRKKFEYERHLACKAAHSCEANVETVGPYWHRGWIPLVWLWQRQLDFYTPAAANILLALCIEKLF